MANIVKRILCSASVLLLGISAQTASASAAVIHPMTFDECGTNANYHVYNCMYVNGAGLYASEVRGWADGSGLVGISVHEEVTGPNGTVCNSSTVYISSATQVVGCQVYPNANIPAGTYCSKVWYYVPGSGYWIILAENCGNVSA